MNGLRSSSLWWVRFEAWTWISQYPRLYLPLAKIRKKPGRGVFDRDTEVVIEGYPRSGNTFGFAAFVMAQSREIRIAHHLHAASQVVAAVARGTPCLVFIREPSDAILSYLQYAPYLSALQCLRRYIVFYERIERYRDKYVVATFREVVRDYGIVLRTLNRKFGTHFTEFEHTEENVSRCFAFMETLESKSQEGRGEATVARPSEQRQQTKEGLRLILYQPRLRQKLQRAKDIYHRYEAYATEHVLS